MLEISINENELFDENTNRFIKIPQTRIELEHSLISISKWESQTHKRFFSTKDMTPEEKLQYIKCMTITKNVNPNAYYGLTRRDFKKISEYINDPMTATTFSKSNNQKPGSEQVSSELVYYWMTELNIPWEAEKWHINRLLTLIKVCSIKRQPPKKMSKADTLRHYDKLNASRRARMHSKG